MQTLITLCLFGAVIGAIYSILSDLGYLDEVPNDPLAAEKRAKQRQEAGCFAARQHLKEFCAAYRNILRNAFPPAMMTPFIASEMSGDKSTKEAWTACLRKITELLPLVVEARQELLRVDQIDAEIDSCRQRLARARRVTQIDDLDFQEEIEDLKDKIRGLQDQKRKLFALCRGAN